MSQWSGFRFARTGIERVGSPVGRSALVALIAVFLLVAPGCSDDETGGVLVDPCLDFTPESASVPGAVTTRLADESTCTLATLEIVATGIDDVWSLDTTVTYDPAVVAWTGNSIEGSVLGEDGTAVAAIIDATASGELTVGVSRVAADEGMDIVDPGVLVRLFFTLNTTSADSGAVELGQNCLTTPDPQDPGGHPVELAVNCSGGTLRVE
jgi:hypothetical protein